MTYTELKDIIADELNRQDLTSVIPTFIRMCEASLNRDLRHWKMEKRASTTFNDRYHTLPTDWLETMRIHLDTGEPLTMLSVDEMQTIRPKDGKPTHYAHVAGEIELYPTPDDDYAGEIFYRSKLSGLEAEENFVSDDHIDIYVYGSLVHSAPYLQDDQRIAVWLSLYQQALNSANAQSQQAKYSGTGLKMKLRG